ncbi:ATP-binding protein [Leptolyngbya sp. FACHB-17]|uniref:ATP-binding protein n=1 Tax=unclassified Leptolyngbya TaxID=2650499 RepID=UPI00168148E5|nr:ATP-binding protein [Leptolyngbya sp. FACHB-17]MBD2080935.1 ATP-binding protein [Leptolyngbya sp. FACHB-17]
MSNLEQWQVDNDQYLSAALHWLRLRLTNLTETASDKGLLASPSAVSPHKLQQAEQALATAAQMQPPPALMILSERFGLSPFEQNILLLCIAPELDTHIPSLCAQAQDHANWTYPTFALALTCFEQPTWDALSPERPLRYWRLLEIQQSSTQPLTTSALRVDERIVNYIKGLNYLDDRLTSFLMPLESPPRSLELPRSQQATLETVIDVLEQSDWETSIVQLVGSDSPSKQLIAQQIATLLKTNLYRLPIELLPTQANELETLARLWHRETLLLPIALYLDAHDRADTPSDGAMQPLHRFLLRSGGLIFISSREAQPGLTRSDHTIDIQKPTPPEQYQLWTEALGNTANHLPGLLSSQFDLNAVAIPAIAQSALASKTSDDSFCDQIWQKCLTYTRPRLDTLARRLDPKATWETLVLPDEELNLLHQIVEQVRHRSTVYQQWGFQERMNRGLGISALFSGESGTGKTMAAEVLANDLQLNLYRIDLSAVVSKYIGETEKNLRRLFDAAEDGGTILFFDEADALFGKRSEVKDSHDRYANIEINYLLQRIESYSGLAILATNLKNALDQAFMRRLRFVINFPFPGVKERSLIWQKAFPPQVPLQDLDFNRLAKLNLTGGSIHNVVLTAAFLAAHAGTPVAMPIVLSAARTEFRKLDRPINEAEFRWISPTGVTR